MIPNERDRIATRAAFANSAQKYAKLTKSEVKALAPWMGAKRTLAPRIVNQIGPHKFYVEPFCGSLSVLLAKPQSNKELAGDVHEEVGNLVDILKDEPASKRLFSELSKVPMCESIQQEADERYPLEKNPYRRAKYWLISSWMNRNGFSGTEKAEKGFAVRYTTNGGCPAKRWRSVVDTIPWWVERLRNVTFVKRDAFTYLGKLDDRPTTVVYADIPYPIETRNKSTLYAHDFYEKNAVNPMETERKKHEELASLFNEYLHARIIVSSYDCPMIREIYADWNVLPVATNKQLSQSSKRNKAKSGTNAPELLFINSEIYPE